MGCRNHTNWWRGYGRATTKGLEASIRDVSRVINLDLEFHHIPASWGSHQSSANIGIIFVKRAYIAWVVVMLHHLCTHQDKCKETRARQNKEMNILHRNLYSINKHDHTIIAPNSKSRITRKGSELSPHRPPSSLDAFNDVVQRPYRGQALTFPWCQSS